ncbi:MAG: tetratricopeptide repeat protein [Acidobacteriota bacterium]|nr:tetratricopeptide repeat protein [Blastocatellia bacterium]MDW8238583.1 tetratricopeptide repeat protein [Acidobacteriota bacterium]
MGLSASLSQELALAGQPATKSRARHATARVVVVTQEPGVSVYLNGAFRGKTNERGQLVIQQLPAGRYQLRARKVDFKDYRSEFRVAAGQVERLALRLIPTRDPAEQAYQRAEQWREERRHADAVTEYQRALELRPSFPAARLGLARSLLALNRYEEAQQQAEAAIAERRRQDPEGYTVLANILRGMGLYEEAVQNYRRALRLARNFSPEAHAGLAMTLEFMDAPDEAIPHMQQAIAQNGDAEPILYSLLGTTLLNVNRKQEALVALERFLALAPDSNEAPAIQSLVEQLRQELRP